MWGNSIKGIKVYSPVEWLSSILTENLGNLAASGYIWAISDHSGCTVTNKLLNRTEVFPVRQLSRLCLLIRRWMGG